MSSEALYRAGFTLWHLNNIAWPSLNYCKVAHFDIPRYSPISSDNPAHLLTPSVTYTFHHPINSRYKKAGSLPLMDPAPLVSQGDGDCPRLAEAEVLAVVMIVRCDPAHPHRRRVLSSKHSHRVVVLPWKNTQHSRLRRVNRKSSITKCFQICIVELIYSCDASVVNSSIFFWRMAAQTKTQQQVLRTTKWSFSQFHCHFFITISFIWITTMLSTAVPVWSWCLTWVSLIRPVSCLQSNTPQACWAYSRSCHCCCSACQTSCGWPWGREGCLPFRRSSSPEGLRVRRRKWTSQRGDQYTTSRCQLQQHCSL